MPAENPLLLALAVALPLTAVFLLLGRRLFSPVHRDGYDPNWVAGFSMAKYRPMERLLGGVDDEFIRGQSCLSPQSLARLRRERRRIFRLYLRSMKRDFARLHHSARVLVLCSSEERPDLAAALLRLRASFAVASAAIEFRLLLHALGADSVDVRGLLDALESLRVQVQPAPAPVAA